MAIKKPLFWDSTTGDVQEVNASSDTLSASGISFKGGANSIVLDGSNNIVFNDALISNTSLYDLTNNNLTYEARSNTLASTTSATDVVLISITTPEAGNYLFFASSGISLPTNNSNASLNIYVGGTLYADTETTVSRGSQPATLCYSVNGLVTLNGAQNIDIRWRASSSADSGLRSLILIKVA